jgi:calcium-dependent protein kinase
LFILLCGKPPFFGDTDKEILEQVEKGIAYKKGNMIIILEEEWKYISKEAQNLVDQMLNTNPSKRISISECFRHPWFDTHKRTYTIEESCLRDYYFSITSFKTDKLFFFQQAILSYMVHHLTQKEDIGELRNVFLCLEKKFDGKLYFSDIIDGLKKGFPNSSGEKEVLAVLKFIDQTNIGYLEYEEFLKIVMDRKTFLTEERLRVAFSLFDKDGSGSISPQELKDILGLQSKFNDKTWDFIIKSVDQNGDGQVRLDDKKRLTLLNLGI